MASVLGNQINFRERRKSLPLQPVQRHWHVAIRGSKTKWKNIGELALFSVLGFFVFYSCCCLVGFLSSSFWTLQIFSCEAYQQPLWCSLVTEESFFLGFQHIFTCTTVEFLGRKFKIIPHVQYSGTYEYNLIFYFHIILGKNFKKFLSMLMSLVMSYLWNTCCECIMC